MPFESVDFLISFLQKRKNGVFIGDRILGFFFGYFHFVLASDANESDTINVVQIRWQFEFGQKQFFEVIDIFNVSVGIEDDQF